MGCVARRLICYARRMTTIKPKRKPAGAAVRGAVDRPKHYPHTLVFLISDDMLIALGAQVAATGTSKSEIAREWLEAGRAASAAV